MIPSTQLALLPSSQRMLKFTSRVVASVRVLHSVRLLPQGSLAGDERRRALQYLAMATCALSPCPATSTWCAPGAPPWCSTSQSAPGAPAAVVPGPRETFRATWRCRRVCCCTAMPERVKPAASASSGASSEGHPSPGGNAALLPSGPQRVLAAVALRQWLEHLAQYGAPHIIWQGGRVLQSGQTRQTHGSLRACNPAVSDRFCNRPRPKTQGLADCMT